eukprot:4238906-Prymnesium_polylepis.1
MPALVLLHSPGGVSTTAVRSSDSEPCGPSSGSSRDAPSETALSPASGDGADPIDRRQRRGALRCVLSRST